MFIKATARLTAGNHMTTWHNLFQRLQELDQGPNGVALERVEQEKAERRLRQSPGGDESVGAVRVATGPALQHTGSDDRSTLKRPRGNGVVASRPNID